MPLITTSHDSLPYIDTHPTPSESAAITHLIAAELSPDAATKPHPLLPPPPPPSSLSYQFPSLTTDPGEEERGGIDLSRYTPPHSTLLAAYTSSTHLSTRLTNLSLLSAHGKNAWLIHNSQLESLLLSLESQLASVQTEVVLENKARKAAQLEVADELRRLEARWRKGVGRVLEVELAAEGVRREAVEARRRGGA